MNRMRKKNACDIYIDISYRRWPVTSLENDSNYGCRGGSRRVRSRVRVRRFLSLTLDSDRLNIRTYIMIVTSIRIVGSARNNRESDSPRQVRPANLRRHEKGVEENIFRFSERALIEYREHFLFGKFEEIYAKQNSVVI